MQANHKRPRPFVLIVIDGYGISFSQEGNAIALARKPHLQQYMRQYPLAAVQAGGIAVGLPWGEMGNSETGHQNIGSGRVLYQALPRISLAIQSKAFFHNEALVAACQNVKNSPDAALHIMGILSDGGVHGHIDHLLALLELAAAYGIGKRTYIHAFLDGRDSPPGSAGSFVGQLEEHTKKLDAGIISTIIGRYYAMDRAENWDRTEKAYNLLVHRQGTEFTDWQSAVKSAYLHEDRKSFETAEPMLVTTTENPTRSIQDGDSVIFYNYRPDRARQLTAAFIQAGFDKFKVTHWQNLKFATMTNFDSSLPALVAFPDEHIDYPLGRIWSDHKLKQYRIAEGEKFAHITYFFNGGHEEPYPGEKDVNIPSLDVKDFSEYPGMHAAKVTDNILTAIQGQAYDVLVMNYANPDMIAHTGNLKATIKAVEVVDEQIGRVVEATLVIGGAVMITGDHGNAESVIDQLTHSNSTDHTNNPVPLIYITPNNKQDPLKSDETVSQILEAPIGVLADVAPTILEVMHLPKPEQMTAQSLLKSLS